MAGEAELTPPAALFAVQRRGGMSPFKPVGNVWILPSLLKEQTLCCNLESIQLQEQKHLS